jgi:glycolate oxidase iron-sulfur subunit
MSGRGRIAILNGILSGSLKPSRGALERVYSCIQCGACARNCPPGINIPEVIYSGRKVLKKYSGRDMPLRVVTNFALNHPDICFDISQISKKPVHLYLKRKGLIPASYAFPETSLKDLPQVMQTQKQRGRVAVFKGCSINYSFPDLGRSLIRFLLSAGYEVILPKAEVCCGIPFRTLGMEKQAKAFARKNVDIFSRIKADAIISLCPTCIMALKHEYKHLINKSIENIMDVASFITGQKGFTFTQQGSTRAFYHDPCHMLYGLKIKDEPRNVLEQCGANLVEGMRHACCGFGGIYSIKFTDSSMKQALSRKQEIEKAGVETVITSCPGCMLQLKKVMGPVNVLHIIEVIEKAMG